MFLSSVLLSLGTLLFDRHVSNMNRTLQLPTGCGRGAQVWTGGTSQQIYEAGECPPLPAIVPWRGLPGHTSLGWVSDSALGCSPDLEEGRTPGRSTAWLQLLRIVLFGKCPEQGHASGSNKP